MAEEVLQAYRRTASNTSCAADLRSGLQAVTDPSLRRWLASEVHAAAAELAAAGAVPSEESAAAGSEQSEQGSMQSGTRPSNSSQGAELRTFQARVSAYQASALRFWRLLHLSAGLALLPAVGGASAVHPGLGCAGMRACHSAPRGHCSLVVLAGQPPLPPSPDMHCPSGPRPWQVEYDLGLPEFGAPGEAQEHAAAVLGCYQAHLHISGGRRRWAAVAAGTLPAGSRRGCCPCPRAHCCSLCPTFCPGPLCPTCVQPSALRAAPADEKERGYGEDLVCIAAAALLRAAQLEAAPQQAGRRLLEVRCKGWRVGW